MAKTKISEFSATPANNTDIDGINIAEGCAPSGINDAIRELMAQLKDWQSGTSNDPYVIGSSGSLTLNQGTANGIPYLNGSKVVTSGSALTFDGTNFATTGSVTSAGASNSGNLAFTGTSNRITGDFTNGTLANRVMFQTSTTNGSTSVSAIPNGTNTQTDLFVFNAADPANAGLGLFRASATEVTLRSAITGTGSYLPMTFYTGGSERMRVDTSGNVGIGTSSPGYKLDVSATSFIAASVSTSYSGAGNIRIADASTTSASAPYVGSVGNNLTFGRLGTAEYVRIDSSGNLLVGKTTSSTSTGAGLVLYGQSTISGYGRIDYVKTNSGTNTANEFSYNGTPVGTITYSNTATAYNTSSDYRLKNTIAPMTGALAKVAALKPCTYKWNADGSDGEGFIAHELQAVVPQCVTGEKDAVDAEGNPQYQGIDTSFLVATLTAAIQEQQAIITALTARVEALESN